MKPPYSTGILPLAASGIPALTFRIGIVVYLSRWEYRLHKCATYSESVDLLWQACVKRTYECRRIYPES